MVHSRRGGRRRAAEGALTFGFHARVRRRERPGAARPKSVVAQTRGVGPKKLPRWLPRSRLARPSRLRESRLDVLGRPTQMARSGEIEKASIHPMVRPAEALWFVAIRHARQHETTHRASERHVHEPFVFFFFAVFDPALDCLRQGAHPGETSTLS